MYQSAAIDRGNLMVRFTDDATQLRARDYVKDEKNGLARDYLSAMSYASRAPSWMQAVGLRGARNKMPTELSGGMARRAALARTIALDPELIMYDEPFTGQDPISMGVLVNLIHRLNQALSATSVVVSHDVHETAKIADLIDLISEGKVIASGSPTELSRSSNDRVRQFMHGLPDGPVPFHQPALSLAQDLGL